MKFVRILLVVIAGVLGLDVEGMNEGVPQQHVIVDKDQQIGLAKDLLNNLNENQVKFITIGRNSNPGYISIRNAFYVFSSIDKKLGGDGLISHVSNVNLKSENLYKENGKSFRQLHLKDQQKVYDSFITDDEVAISVDYINGLPVVPAFDGWTVVVFSETFFAAKPLDTKAIELILYLCGVLTQKHPKLLIHINFLHAFEHATRPNWLPNKHIDNQHLNGDSDRIISSCSLDIFRSDSNLRLANYSLMVWRGANIAFYRKSSYCNECDALVNEGFTYEFGDFSSHALCGVYEDFANTLLSFLETRICYDLESLDKIPDKTLVLVPARQAPSYPFSSCSGPISDKDLFWLGRFKNKLLLSDCFKGDINSDVDRGNGLIVGGRMFSCSIDNALERKVSVSYPFFDRQILHGCVILDFGLQGACATYDIDWNSGQIPIGLPNAGNPKCCF